MGVEAGYLSGRKIVNLGAGGMEVDRQVISHLLEKKYDKSIIFIGVDKSPVTNKIAKENLNSLGKRIEIFDFGLGAEFCFSGFPD